jgi:hypothetical protein
VSKDFASQVLPTRRRASFVEFVSDRSFWQIAGAGLLLYLGPVILFSAFEAALACSGHPVVYRQDAPADIWEIPYFNFITIITIGYGDLRPIGVGRLFSVIEGVLGVGVFSLLVAALTAKLLSPRTESIVFSRFGYYCTDQQRFLLIFVNTTNSILVNVDMTSYFKLGGDWAVRPPIRTPFVTKSVQTFFLDREPLDGIIAQLADGDVFRFGITGSLGISAYSTAVEYRADEIIVLRNRDALTAYAGFRSPDFRSEDISEMFHYRPDGALTLAEHVACERGVTTQ